MRDPNMSEQEDQIRQCYGRIVYTHKTHEKSADRLLTILHRWEYAQILVSLILILSTLPSALGLSIKFNEFPGIEVLAAISSAFLFGLSLHLKDANYKETAMRHQQTAMSLWLIREKYLSLIADIHSNVASMHEVQMRRDRLLEDSSLIMKNAPRTDSEAYQLARTALKENEEMTFSDCEIDAFLPKKLRKLE